jgi:hypothetical protein
MAMKRAEKGQELEEETVMEQQRLEEARKPESVVFAAAGGSH